MRPGPEYVLRQYRFYDGGLFDLRLFHYSDSECRNATHSVSARGRYHFYQPSWIVPGAAETDYQLSHAGVVPYTTTAADELRRRLTGGGGDRTRNGSLSTSGGGTSKVTEACAKVAGDRPWPPLERREVYAYMDTDDSVETSSE